MLTSKKKILCIGDSTTMGYSSDSTDYKLSTWPTCLTTLIRNNGSNPASCENFFGSLFGYTYTNLDSRMTVPTSWITEGGGYYGYFSLGGGLFQATNTIDSIIFKPRGSVNIVEVYTAPRGGSLQVTITDSSGNIISTTQVSNQSANILQKTVISIASNSGISVALKASQTPVFLCGVSCFTSGDIQVLNAGVGGATAQCWNDNSALTRAKDCINFLQPDMIILCLGINDYWHSFTDYLPGLKVDTFQNMMTEIIQACNTCPMVIYTPNPTNVVTSTIERNYCNTIMGLSQFSNVTVFDLNNIMTNYTTAFNAGYITNDNVHPSKAGYQYIAQQLYNFLK
jgi:lysophospholipase L1-like esterase